ncbi:hypothetical protein [Actinoplanes sp. GCM10030250]|uniref:hypothetical protein n=1 Tax=Actinoplanes sp. GCM10030250 TaxID=3273376 RepID=UPI003612E787
MFADAAEPLQHLTSPTGHSESILGQPFSSTAALDWLSPTHLVNEFVKTVSGYDVFGDAAAAVSGDWELVWQCAGAYRALAGALQDIGVNVSAGNIQLDQSWDGNAADAAYTCFTALSAAVSAQRIPLTELAKGYEQAAEGTYRLTEALSGLMKDIADSALIGALGAAVGTATIQTGVGFVTGWGVAAYEAYKIGQMTARAREIIAAGSAVIGTATGFIQSASGDTSALARHPLPQAAYHHPETSEL